MLHLACQQKDIVSVREILGKWNEYRSSEKEKVDKLQLPEEEKKSKKIEIDKHVLFRVHRPSFSWEWGSEGLHRETANTQQAREAKEKFALGVTPLMIACSYGSLDIVSEILDFDDEGSVLGTGDSLHAVKRLITIESEEYATHEILFDKFPLPGIEGKELPFGETIIDKEGKTKFHNRIIDYTALFMVLDIIDTCNNSKEKERFSEWIQTQTEIANKILGEMLFQTGITGSNLTTDNNGNQKSGLEEINWPTVRLLGHDEEESTPITCSFFLLLLFFF